MIFSLFIASFLSATLLPGSSEIFLIGVLASGEMSTWIAIAIATLGNTLGSITNWIIGRFFSSFRDHPRFPVPSEKFAYYTSWYQRWGIWTLLLSWVPVIGDPLTVVAGIARTPLWLFAIIVLVAKLMRYLAVAGLFSLVWS